MEFNLDEPIGHENQDRFERYNFAKRLANICTNKNSKAITVGIYGKWGEGKSSLVNLVSKSLPEDIIQIKFNPWYFNNQEQLVKEFFKLFASTLERNIENKSERIANLISQYEEMLGIVGQIPKIGIGAKILKLWVSIFKPSKFTTSSKLKAKIDDFIIDANKNIVVFIDDIDRLDVSEVELIFKLVKLLADFPRTTYFLSFDVELVARILSPRYGGNAPESGHAFLEKIIQIPIVIPKARDTALRKYIIEILEKVMDSKVISEKRFEDAFATGLTYLLSNPRKAIRFSNTLQFCSPLLIGEVDLCDLIILESIKASLPEIYLFIRENSELFLSDYHDEKANKYSDIKSPALKKVNAAIESYPEKIRQAIVELTCLMFPRFVWVDPAEGRGINMEKALIQKRICSPQYFERYFSYSLQQSEMSDTHLEKFYLNAGNHRVEDLVTQFRTDFTNYTVDDVLFKLVYHRKNIAGQSAKNLVLALSILSDSYAEKEAFNWGSPFSWAAMIVQALIERLDEESALQIAIESIELSSSILFAAELVARFVMPESEENKQTIFKGKNALSIKKAYVNRVKILINNSDFFEALPEENMVRFLIWWYDVDNESLTTAIEEVLNEDFQASLKLLRIFTPTVHSIGGDYNVVKKFKSNFQEEQYLLVDKVVGADKLFSKLQTRFGDKSGLPKVSSLDRNDSIDDDTLIGIFQKLHKERKEWGEAK